MEIATLVFAVVAFILAAKALSRSSGGNSTETGDLKTDIQRRVANLGEELRSELKVMKRQLAQVSAGESLSAEQIEEGRLWRDMLSAEAEALLSNGGLVVLDVRTHAETSTGVIPGAQLIPIDQLEERLSEVPKSKSAMLVYCAGGGRSAAACEFLAAQGYDGLINLAGGIGSWSGPVEKPA